MKIEIKSVRNGYLVKQYDEWSGSWKRWVANGPCEVVRRVSDLLGLSQPDGKEAEVADDNFIQTDPVQNRTQGTDA